MKFKPYDYQAHISNFIMETKRGNVWADMGLGKTVATLTALDALWLLGSRFTPALVLAPMRVARSVWPRERLKWDHLNGMRISPIIGTASQRENALKTPADVYTINYENIPWLVDKLGGDWPFKIVIADESTQLKSFRLRRGGVRAAALAKASSSTGRWVNLTGTPAPQGLIDLWGQNWYVDHGKRLGHSYSAFFDRWFKRNQYSHEITPHDFAEDQITEALSDVTLSLRASDYFDLPPLVENIIEVDLPPPARKQYRQMEDEMGTEIDGQQIEALNAAALSMKLLQFASGAAYTGDAEKWVKVHDAKIDALKSIVDEQAGNPLIVAYHFKSDLVRLKKAFPKGRELVTAKDEDAWNKGRIPVMFLHPDSAGHGLNLQDGGNAMAFFSHWWKLESFLQVVERIGPMRQLQAGYTRPTILHFIVARDTADEDVILRRKTKQSVQNALRAGIQRRRQHG